MIQFDENLWTEIECISANSNPYVKELLYSDDYPPAFFLCKEDQIQCGIGNQMRSHPKLIKLFSNKTIICNAAYIIQYILQSIAFEREIVI